MSKQSTEPHWLAEAFASAQSIELKLPGITVDGGQLVMEIHNEVFRLPEDWVRWSNWVDDWRRAAERDPQYRPKEDDCIDNYLRAARKFCLGKLHWPPDQFSRAIPQEYEDGLIGYYDLSDSGREPSRKRTSQHLTRAPGRPPKPFLGQLAGFGAAWLSTHGTPDTQAELERALLDECERRGWRCSERRVRGLASEMIATFRKAMAD
jgi:hypothetical protein